MKRIHIHIGKNCGEDTRVTDAETGEVIDGVCEIVVKAMEDLGWSRSVPVGGGPLAVQIASAEEQKD